MESLYIHMKKEYEQHVQMSKYTHVYRGILTDYYEQNIIYPSFDEIIDNDDSAMILIRSLLNDCGFSDFVDFINVVTRRSRHIVSVWLLGLVFCDFEDVKAGCDLYNQSEFYLLWLLTAVIHDYGYFINEVNNNVDSNFVKNSYLFSTQKMNDVFCPIDEIKYKRILSYTIDEIKKYYEYSLEYHKNKKDNLEKADHGIVGGCKAFNDYYNWWLKQMPMINESPRYEELFKMACAIVTQHNMFKSSKTTTDSVYLKFGLNRLTSCEDPLVKRDNKILFLLCLVDTIDIIKRKNISSDIYKLIMVRCNKKHIYIKYNRFVNESTYVNKKDKRNCYKSLIKIKHWMVCKTSLGRRNIVVIS